MKNLKLTKKDLREWKKWAGKKLSGLSEENAYKYGYYQALEKIKKITDICNK